MRGKPLVLETVPNGCISLRHINLFLMRRSQPLVGGFESGKRRDYPKGVGQGV